MKLKEVCIRTNLSEQTIINYVDRKFIMPDRDMYNEQNGYTFTEENINELLIIKELINFKFTDDHIVEMKDQPDHIHNILSQHLMELLSNEDENNDIIRTILKIQNDTITDVAHLASKLSAIEKLHSIVQHETTPNFSRFESESAEEKELAYEQFVVAQKKREAIQKIVKPIMIVIVVLIGFAILARIAILISGIPHTIDKQFSAVQFDLNDESIIENTTITIKGKLYKKWFTYYKFDGSFIVHNYEFTETYFSFGIVFFYDDLISKKGSLSYFSNDRTTKIETLGMVSMTDDFEKVLINIFEPIDSDTLIAKDLWIAAPATSREEAIGMYNELVNTLANK